MDNETVAAAAGLPASCRACACGRRSLPFAYVSTHRLLVIPSVKVLTAVKPGSAYVCNRSPLRSLHCSTALSNVDCAAFISFYHGTVLSTTTLSSRTIPPRCHIGELVQHVSVCGRRGPIQQTCQCNAARCMNSHHFLLMWRGQHVGS